MQRPGLNYAFLFIGGILITIIIACGPRSNATQDHPATGKYYSYRTASADGIGKFYMGREIAHVMGAGGGSWLEREERAKEEGTQEILRQLHLSSNSVVADIGAGTGYYTFKMAKAIPAGKVLAVEIQNDFIQYLKNVVDKQHIANVQVIEGEEKSPNLPANSIDLAIMVDVYHELEFPVEMLQAIFLSLKPGGRLLLLEYKKEDPEIPIKELHKMSMRQADKELLANGFLKDEYGSFLPLQHYLMYKKPW